MQSTNFSIAVLAFEQLTAAEKAAFINPRLLWAGTDPILDEAFERECILKSDAEE